MTGQLRGFPDIDVPWDKLAGAAEGLGLRGSAANGYLADAAAAWSGLRQAYRQPETEAAVHNALDGLTDPLFRWQQALAAARTALEAFVAAGRPLQAESEELAASRPALLSALAEAGESGEIEDPDSRAARAAAAAGRLAAFNARADGLRKDWQALTEQTVAELEAIRGGTGGNLPAAALLGTPSLPVPAWAGFTSGLDEAFGSLSPEDYVRSMEGLSDEELKAWALANPEGAALLAANMLPVWRPNGSPEAVMANASAGDKPLTPEGIAGIRTAWFSLSAEGRERLLLLYPAVLGNLNGVPFASRARANTLTIAGYRETIATQQRELGPEPLLADYLRDAGNQPGDPRIVYQQAHRGFRDNLAKWETERDRLATLRKGLDYAADNGKRVVMVSLNGDGRVVTMEGALGPQTRTTAILVPGTGSNPGQLETYSNNLDAINGEPSASSVSFYWQGTDLPDEIPHNATSSYNETGAPLLAAFDHALDLETPPQARSTYVGYSAGGSLLGTAEREGLGSTNIVYVATAGTGHDVSSPEDTANPDANRYWVQTRSDPIAAAQVLGGGFHGGSFWKGGSPANMDVVRLESGFLRPEDPKSLMEGHVDYFFPGSTAASNVQGVVEGTNVSLFVEDNILSTNSPYPLAMSPIEASPEDYAYGKLGTVTVESLEK
jgi:hypothetical protein